MVGCIQRAYIIIHSPLDSDSHGTSSRPQQLASEGGSILSQHKLYARMVNKKKVNVRLIGINANLKKKKKRQCGYPTFNVNFMP